jgi:hypothetical protein
MTATDQTIIQLLTEIRDELQKPDAGEEAARQQAFYNMNRFKAERAAGLGQIVWEDVDLRTGRKKDPAARWVGAWPDPISSDDPIDHMRRFDGFTLPPQHATGSAKMRGPLPDARATPGLINPDVTPDTLHETIGRHGWTASIRPPASYTGPLKVQKMIEYGCTGSPDEYELDHLVPLCCGGHPFDERNLWPQPRAGLLGASVKDITEVAARRAILNGVFSLSAIQMGFMHDWVSLHASLIANPKVRSLMMAVTLPEQEP